MPEESGQCRSLLQVVHVYKHVRAPFAPLPVHNIEGHLQHEGIISEPHFFVSDKLRVSLMDAGT